ncbi:MAG: hypothetical protein COV59_02260 [Candidatus Magasanikbacteria bacterium CG11_big_fil_rev_8_21_14_0_20_39_34]|uniref:VOC domain-containing protein n=1 Tax=Candidatus Magasanikbacteria bacterium CG11_big_fil_rev_8_21_14_0_20_39_34 TaxID=1974653 RepID=A0A2H0N794_9BACT|nr:MAG: hypothetical protein COV59_02260 [Candidatus Magasanikbacteria bacterium CG11_big_fil_rev_8_21_14_0_20_39_34]
MQKNWNTLTKVHEFRFKMYPKNFDLVKNFYREILQFPIIEEWNTASDDRGVMFDTGSCTVELLSPEGGYYPIQGCSLSFEVKDVWKLWEKFEGQSYVVFSIRHNEWGDTSFKISDPEGLPITFFTKDNV